MNTTQLRTFATEARKSLLSGVKSKMNALGFKDDGTVDKSDYPIQAADGTLFQGEFYDVAFYGKWMRLHDEIARHGFRQVCEEGAYTWFNRLMAIQILAKNGLISPVLEFESSDVRIPLLVKQAHEGICPDMSGLDASRLKAIIADDNRITDQFAILIVAFCQSTPILYKCFGTLNDFTELLLPTNILASNGFLSLLNGSSFITAHDYESTELIGWLYQFYIAERKDEVFASFKSGHKAEADDIPAATQIFTPNWIVKYMVQNTLGRIYLDNNPDSPLKDEWKYLIDTPRVLSGAEAPLSTSSLSTSSLPTSPLSTSPLSTSPLPTSPLSTSPLSTSPLSTSPLSTSSLSTSPLSTSPLSTSPLSTSPLSTLENLTFADLSCGSGHILNEAFDVLFAIYKEEGYTRRQAIKAIFEHNITGVDIDTRARQLATFALMLKACQQWPDAIGCEVMPRVLDMPAPDDPVCDRYPLLKQADNLGSIMKLEPLPGETHPLVLALTQKYAAIAMNPPYMGGGNMNADLAKYVKDNYEDYKSDLFAVFMKVAEDRLLPNAKYGMINMQSWMFLSSFEKLRSHVIDDLQIDSMMHLGPRTFDELSGEVVQNTAFVLTNAKPARNAYYFRLVDFAPSALKEDNFLNCLNAIRCYGDISNMGINLSPYCFNVSQSNFKKIPGCPLGYWVSEKMIEAFENKKIRDYANVITGMTIGDNNKYLRLWHEVSNNKLALNFKSMNDINIKKMMWIPYSKGGVRRQWYGNHDYVVNWSKKEHFNRAKTTLSHLYLQEALTWPFITSGSFSCRFLPHGSLWDVAGSPCFFNNKKIQFYTLGFLASKIANRILPIINPTINVQAIDINNLPLIISHNNDEINRLVETNIAISCSDWDAHETSWDFKENELVRYAKGCTDDGEGLPPRSRVSRNPENGGISLEDCLNAYKHDWEQRFGQLHANEEELNRQFIEIYGLQDELTPDVPLDEITILQQGEISIVDNQIVWHPDVVMKQLISYAIGCMMGRYRLDRPGLHIAHPNPLPEELEPYEIDMLPEPVEGSCNSTNNPSPVTHHPSLSSFTIDDDGIIPLMPLDSGFPDCAAARMSEFVKLVFGEEQHAANMNFLQEALGKDLETYFAKDFYTDHKKRYQNRPIYWLFASKKGAFQCLVYMHRMTPFTVERIRSKYLLPYIERLAGRINDMNASILQLTSAQARTLQKLERDLQECREYHDLLHPVANQNIAIDLDDGVVVNYAKFGPVLAKLK